MLESLFSIGIIVVVLLALMFAFGWLNLLIEKRRQGKYQWQPDLGREVVWKRDDDPTTRTDFYTPVLRDKTPEQIQEERREYLKENRND